jgi:spore coat polysaccharide biosynthesis protein SpsF
MNVVAIIQARMGSTRLPGKVMSLIQGESLLQVIIRRISRAECIDTIVVATTKDSDDDVIYDWCIKNGINVIRGESNDVLSRFYHAATAFQAEVVVRITADDPLKDPTVIDRAVTLCQSNPNLDYVSNTLLATYPEGLDVEVFVFSALTKAFNEAVLMSDREHVTPYIWRNPTLFKCLNFEHKINYSHIRFTVDYENDLEFIRQLVMLTPNGLDGSMVDFLETINKYPALCNLNCGIIRNQGYLDSIKRDVDGGMI